MKVYQVVLEITAFDEHRLAVMAALDNMMGKPGTITLAFLGISTLAFLGISTSLLLTTESVL